MILCWMKGQIHLSELEKEEQKRGQEAWDAAVSAVEGSIYFHCFEKNKQKWPFLTPWLKLWDAILVSGIRPLTNPW